MIEFYRLLQNTNATAIILRYERTSAAETDACAQPKDTPATLSQLQKFYYNLRVRSTDAYTAYVSARIGFDGDSSHGSLMTFRTHCPEHLTHDLTPTAPKARSRSSSIVENGLSSSGQDTHSIANSSASLSTPGNGTTATASSSS